jgi:hypothetical protein
VDDTEINIGVLGRKKNIIAINQGELENRGGNKEQFFICCFLNDFVSSSGYPYSMER